MPSPEVIEYWLKTVSVYGLGFVLMACLTAIFIWGTWKFAFLSVGILASVKDWLPRIFGGALDWINTTKDNNTALVASFSSLAESTRQIAENSEEQRKEFRELAKRFACSNYAPKESP